MHAARAAIGFITGSWVLLVTIGCGGAPTETAGAQGPLIATAFEASLVGPLVEEVRAGVRPFDDESLGLCRGAQSCESFLGPSVDDPLPPGEYGLHAALRVPPVGAPGTWKVALTTTCEGDATPYTREHTVSAPPGVQARPFRVLLQRITSPNPDGPRSCTWTLDAPHPDRTIRYEGAWSTP